MTYLIWHYTSGFKAGLAVARDVNYFIANFFSLPILVKTLFSPWRRLAETYGKGLNPEQWFETLIVNVLMRVVGAIIRLAMIVSGLIILVLVLLVSLLALLAWLLLPVIFISLVVGGLFLISK